MIVTSTQVFPSTKDLLVAAIVDQKAFDKNGIQIEKSLSGRIAEIALEQFSLGVTDLTHLTKDDLGLNVAMILLPERKVIILTGCEIARGTFKKALDALQIDFSEEGIVKVEKVVELRIKGFDNLKYDNFVAQFENGENCIETIGSPHLIGKSLCRLSYMKTNSKKNNYLKRCINIVRNEGVDLGKFIKGEIVYSQLELIQFLKGVANGLIDMHSKRIVHRDLKAENVLVKNSTGVIADLDSAESIDKMIRITHGTPIAMSPEIILAKVADRPQLQTPAADCWAFGSLIYSLFHPQRSRPPFARIGPRAFSLFWYNLNRLPEKPDPAYLYFDWIAKTEIEIKVQDLICQLFIKNPKDRMTAEQALAALEKI